MRFWPKPRVREAAAIAMFVHDDPHIEIPPVEAYSRVTNPGRFAPLHNAVLELFGRLGAEFDVQRREGYGLDPELEIVALAQPVVQLIPADPAAAPITAVFTTFPSVLLRCGRWLVAPFPSCGCDACNETADKESERFRATMDDVVCGRFKESISIPLLGSASQKWELGAQDAPRGYRSGGLLVKRSRARQLIDNGPRACRWKAWSPRASR